MSEVTCQGTGQPSAVRYYGEITEDGERKYLCRCPWCDKPQSPGVMPEHTYVPIGPDEVTFREGGFLVAVEDWTPIG